MYSTPQESLEVPSSNIEVTFLVFFDERVPVGLIDDQDLTDQTGISRGAMLLLRIPDQS